MNWKLFIVYLTLNFGALGLGSLFADPVNDLVYQQLNRAPWTPTGWVFGVAWFTIMLLFSVFMTKLMQLSPPTKHKGLLVLFGAQWLLNVSWNPVFFGAHAYLPGLFVLILLFGVLTVLVYTGYRIQKIWTLTVLPYWMWLIIAISMNA